jgi:putative transposase
MKDHVHLVVIVPPKVSISELMGFLKGKTAIGLFITYRNLPSYFACWPQIDGNRP